MPKEREQSLNVQPACTARAQKVYREISESPVGTLMVELVELYRDVLLQETAVREIFHPDYRSGRQLEIERRAFEAEESGRSCWRLRLKDEAAKHWRRADRFWAALDKLKLDEKISLAVMAAVAERRNKGGA